MTISKTGGIAMAGACLILASCIAMPQAANSQTQTIIEKQVVVPHSVLEFTSAPVARSNYSKRLSDILEQINMAADKGWVTTAQADYMRGWQADVCTEEKALRINNGGIVNRGDADTLEKHVTGLSYYVAKQMNR